MKCNRNLPSRLTGSLFDIEDCFLHFCLVLIPRRKIYLNYFFTFCIPRIIFKLFTHVPATCSYKQSKHFLKHLLQINFIFFFNMIPKIFCRMILSNFKFYARKYFFPIIEEVKTRGGL